jgi:aspartyl protease family protein
MLLPILLQICTVVEPGQIFASAATDDSALAVRTEQSSSSLPPKGGLVIFGPVATPQGNEIGRAADGLFYVTAIVNGAPVRFIVDTGATTVVLTREDARRAGITLDDQHFDASAQTAAGNTAMARIVLQDVVVGNKRTRAVDAAVVRADLPVSLLGQNWLSKLDSLTITGDRLLFR